MRYLLDTNSCIYLFVGAYPALTARLAEQPAGDVAISVITFAELALGSGWGKPPPPDLLAAFTEEVPVVDFDRAAALAYARLPFRRANFDRLLAAHALSIGATIVTNNEVDFADVPGLKVENWAA